MVAKKTVGAVKTVRKNFARWVCGKTNRKKLAIAVVRVLKAKILSTSVFMMYPGEIVIKWMIATIIYKKKRGIFYCSSGYNPKHPRTRFC
jgi:hypothetical protein